MRKDSEDFIRNQELYEFQFNELNQFDIQLDEDIELQERISTIKKNKDIYETLYKLANLNNSSSHAIRAISDSIDLMSSLPEEINYAKSVIFSSSVAVFWCLFKVFGN